MVQFAIATAIAVAANIAIYYLTRPEKPETNDDEVLAKSGYGFPIEKPYGKVRLNSRNFIWALPIRQEEEEAGKGGGGGGEISYFGTFAVVVCWEEIVAVNRIWFGKELVYNSDPTAEGEIRENSAKFQTENLEIYYGTDDQLPSPTIEENEGIGNVPGLRKVAYLVVKNYSLETKNFPTVDVEVTRGDAPIISNITTYTKAASSGSSGNTGTTIQAPIISYSPLAIGSIDTIRTVIVDLLGKINIPPEKIEFDDYCSNTTINGCIFKQDGSTPQSLIEELQKAYFFFPQELGDRIKFLAQETPETETITEISLGDLGVRESESADLVSPYKQTIVNPREIPSEFQFEYVNAERDYDLGSQTSYDASATHKNDANTRSTLIFTDTEGANIAWKTLQQLLQQSRKFEEIRIFPSRAEAIAPGSLIKIPINGEMTTIQVADKEVGTNELIQISGIIYENIDPELVINNDYFPRTSINSTAVCGAVALDIPLIKDNDSDFGLYIGVEELSGSWQFGSIYISEDNGSNYSKLTNFTGTTITGLVTQTPGQHNPNIIDGKNEIIVELLGKKTLESIDNQNFLNQVNLGLFGKEIIAFQNAELIGNKTYKLSNLLRGLRGTEGAINQHMNGEQFVLLVGNGTKLKRIAGDATDLGKNLLFKAVHAGQSLDDVNIVTSLTVTGEALKPYAPANPLIIENTANGDLLIKWQLRTRRYGELRNNLGITQADSNNSYIEILDSINNLIRRVEVANSEYLYLAGQQAIDRGATLSQVSFNLAQKSDLIGQGKVLEVRDLGISRYV